jgi:hypothetical protein
MLLKEEVVEFAITTCEALKLLSSKKMLHLLGKALCGPAIPISRAGDMFRSR